VIEGPRKINRHSVISANHYLDDLKRPHETIAEVMGGRRPKLLMDIHKVSEVNKPNVHLNEIEGPATGEVFKGLNGNLLPENK
jgi:NADH-quinone oxidoreductase subunit G